MLLECLGSNKPVPEKIDILEIIRMAVVVWTFNVESKTIADCFLHCKICTVQEEIEEDIKYINYINKLKAFATEIL